MKKEMLINVLQPEECRIAIVEDGILEELYVERTSHEGYTGNIYKGKVVNLEPAIQAAFVDFSVGRNGFLHVSDVEPQYYRRNSAGDADSAPRDRADRDRSERDRPSGPGRDDRRRPPRSTGEDRDLPPPPSYPDDRPIRERPDRSERGRRDRSEPRRFGEGLSDEERASSAAAAAAPPTRPTPPPARPEFEPESPRRLRSEVAPVAPPPPRAVEPPAYARTIDRIDPATTRTYEPEEPRGRGFGVGAGAGAGRGADAEPVDPDLPPSRTARNRVAPPAPTPRPTPVDRDDDFPRARTLPPAPTAAVPPAPPARERVREPEPTLGAPEPEAPPTREPRRGRGRGRGRAGSEVEPRLEAEPDLIVPEPPAFDEPAAEVLPDETPRRRGGRDAIRSRGGERERPERERPEREPEREPERTRPASPERSRGFAAELLEPERPRAAEVERPRAAEVERPRSFEPERPRPVEMERPRSFEPPERPRAAEVERPARPVPVDPELPRERERGRGFGRGLEPEAPRTDARAKPHDRAGEEGYVPRRFRNAPPDPAEPTAFGSTEDDLLPAEGADTDLDADLGEDDLGGKAGDGGPRRRRRRRGRRRDRETTDRLPTSPADEDADPDADADPDVDDLDDLDAATEVIEEEEEIHASSVEEIPSTSDFDFGDDSADHDFEEDDDERVPSARVPGPDDRIDPELEEEIRREIEEIAVLEREMGLRGPVEARPRRGEPASAVGDDGGGRGGRGGRAGGLAKPPLQEIFRRGDEVLVQVIKESIGTKGPTLSTYISIPGRYLVLMPGLNRVGVSRKIADEGQRRKLREIMNDLNPPKGLGFIVRTAGLDRTKGELARDLAYLLRLWKVILTRIKKAKTPAPIYQESDMITRTIRDIFNAEIDTIWIDEPGAFERAQEFLRVVMPRFVDRLKLYDEKVPLFHKYGIEDEIAKIQRRRVDLPEGGSIVIDQTEALVAIDVNSGNFRVENDAERTAYEMNLRAAKEIARQLRLRDLGGVIVNDFIDMRDERNRRGVENALRKAIERDRARTKVLKMSAFGLIEMTRQRIRPSLKRSVYEDCTHCVGAGLVKTVESMSIDVMRILALAAYREDVRRVLIGVSPSVAAHLNNRKRKEIAQLELEANMTIHIRHEESAPAEHLQIDCFDTNNGEIRLFPPPAPERHHRGRPQAPQH